MPATRVYQNWSGVRDQMCLVTEDGTTYHVDATPPKFTHEAAATWAVTKREGQRDVTTYDGPPIEKVTFDLFSWSRDVMGDASGIPWVIQELARRGFPVRIKGGSDRFEGVGWWRITSCKTSVDQRGRNGEGSRITQSLTLERYTKMPGSAITNAKAKAAASKARAQTTQKTAGTYRVRRGDSLWSIAARTLGTGLRWREIYALNRARIGNPNVIQPGLVLALPAKGRAR